MSPPVDTFWFTSRRVEGHPFSLTVFVNSVCHVRLSACCEKKRTVGARLGQGVFTLLSVEGAQPCIRLVPVPALYHSIMYRCVMEEDPIAQKHLARLSRYRGEYDQWGNRLTSTMLNTQHLLGGDDQGNQRKSRDRKKKKEIAEDMKNDQHDITDYNFSKK